jgi:hypothetical protein
MTIAMLLRNTVNGCKRKVIVPNVAVIDINQNVTAK